MQMRKGQYGAMVVPMITLAVFLIIAVSVVITTVESSVATATDLNTVTNESMNITNGTTQTTANTGVRTNSETITSNTGNVTLTRDTNYTISYGDDDSVASVTFTNVNSAVSNGSLGKISYQWASADFQENSVTRTILDQIPILLGVAVLLVVVGFMAFKL